MDSFVVYRSFYEAIKELDDASRLEAYDALMEYALDGIEPEAFESLLAKVIFTMAKPNIDANHERKTNGSKGGRSKKTNGYENEKPMVVENENQWLSNEKTNGFENEKPMVSKSENHRLQKNSSNEDEDEDVNEDVDVDEDKDEDGIIARSENAPSQPTPVITIPLNDNSEYPIYQKEVDEWKTLYPAVDVPQELKLMRGWCLGNPTKRKTKAGIKRFITAWLAKEQNSGRVTAPTVQLKNNAPPYPVRDLGAFIN